MQFGKEGDLGHLCMSKLNFATQSQSGLTVHSNNTGKNSLEQVTLKENLSVFLNKCLPLVRAANYLF